MSAEEEPKRSTLPTPEGEKVLPKRIETRSLGILAIPLVLLSFLSYIGLKSGTRIEINVTVHPNEGQQLRASSNQNSEEDTTTAADASPPPGALTHKHGAPGSFGDQNDLLKCAQDVFLTLHKELGGESEHACRGLLLRDDLILTSRECSKFDFTYDFSGVGILQAVPHPTLNDKVGMDSRLGFLKTSPPYHYYFFDQPTRRTRVFLSNQTSPAVYVAEEETAVVWACNHNKPIAHNFVVDGEMVPLGSLLGVVPDDILWEHRDLDTAPALSYKADHWWTRAVTRKSEEDEMERKLATYEGPPGSISIPMAHEGNFIGSMAGLCEAVDPRGHRRDCFKNYYIRWREERPFSGMHFFDWLDFGHGKFLLETNMKEHLWQEMPGDRGCLKEHFNSHHVYYLNDGERDFLKIYFTPSADGKELIAAYKWNDELVPESSLDDPHLYMWDMNKTFYIVDNRWNKEKYGTIKHTSILAGGPALSAGKAYFGKSGAVWGINFSSGHYRPDIQAPTMMYQWVKDQGFNTESFHWVGRSSWTTKNCQKIEWKGNKIAGFTAAGLNQSCHEVTVNPTWMLKDDV